MDPRVSIVVVNHNGKHLLATCLSATLAQARPLGAQVVLVDNGSTDGSVASVQAAFPEVVIVQSPRNLGFAEGCNVGVQAASGDWIVLLNNDAVPEPFWLERLMAAARPSDVAIACSVVHDPHFPPAYALGTGSISVIGHPIAGANRDPAHPFYATGCSLLFKRHLFPQPFDPDFFAYYEDTLLSWRARLRGLRVARALDSAVQHVGSATASRNPKLAWYFYERNKLLVLLLTYEARTLARLLPLYWFDGAVRLFETLWGQRRRPPVDSARDPLTMGHYLIVWRALGWILLNWPRVAQKRATIQRERVVTDRQIIRYLSGKIFDDVVPSRLHTWANRLALQYCYMSGLWTVEV